MVSRRIVQDSDDDCSSSVGNASPKKSTAIDVIEQNVFGNEDAEIIGEGVEDDRNGSSETRALGESYGSTGSTGGCIYSLIVDSCSCGGFTCQCDCIKISQFAEKSSSFLFESALGNANSAPERLSREITFAHKTILDPSPDSVSVASLTNDQTYQTSGATKKHDTQSSPEKEKISSINHSSASHPSLTSSTPSKPKRRQTTSERKTARTYGSKHTTEVFGVTEDGWEEHYDNLPPRSSSSIVVHRKGEGKTLPSATKSQPRDLDMDVDTLDGTQKRKSNVQRRATMHDFSSSAASETGIAGKYATGALCSLPDGSQTDVLMNGDIQSGGSRPIAETCNMKELELQHFGSSIETSMLDSKARSRERAPPNNIDPLLADEPLLSSLPREHAEDETESLVLAVEQEKRTEQLMAVDAKDKPLSFSELKVVPAREQLSPAHEEFSLPPTRPVVSSSPILLEPPSKKRRRDMQLPSNTPDSDDITTGLPVEHYIPRPSRSRGSRAVDDLVVGIDYSKRPEAVAKAKTKRRKTSGDTPLDKETTAVEKSTQALEGDRVDRHDLYMQADNHQAADENALTGQPPTTKSFTHDKPDSDPIYLPDAPPDVPPKKKRGRPKKQPVDENFAEPKNAPLTKPDQQAESPTTHPAPPQPTAPKSKKSKRSKTAPTIPSSPLITDSDTDKPSPQPFLPALREKKNAANVVKDPPRLASPLKIDEEERREEKTGEESAVVGNGVVREEAEGKGPDKHSPLRKGRGGHRVGLSRKMRIPSLLKVVRK